MRDIKISHENFVNIVAENRNLTLEAVRKLADGSSVMGEQAIKDGLIDEIGSLPDVESYLTEKLGGKANICWQN
jgi:protease-4